MKTYAVCLTIVLISSASLAQAQYSANNRYTSSTSAGYGVPGQYYGFGGPVAGHVHHASTVQEGVRCGMAAQMQAQAQYNLLTSLAVLNMAQAERMQMENQQYRTDTYCGQHQSTKTSQASHAPAAKSAAVPAIAGLAWPTVLQKAQYASFRKAVEQIVGRAIAGNAHPGPPHRAR